MVSFTFKVHDPAGLHARPAGELVKEAGKCTSSVTICNGNKTGDAKRLFKVMSLGVKQDDEVAIIVEGEKEKEEAEVLKEFITVNI